MPENVFIDLPKAVEIVLELIASKPEGYRYQDDPLSSGFCRNVHVDGDVVVPGCLVGSMVVKLGFDPVDIFNKNLESLNSHSLLEELEIESTIAADIYLNRIQVEQDRGGSWADAHMNGFMTTLQREQAEMLTFTPSELEWLGARS